ncbi:hypothetical protein [Chromohalobacter israelensis]|uniref:hypothetical protein n=1 Tax=Chromohalobacter israelensis TaxID=141390 RepID=UPI0015C48BA6|nr:hypothetical protein [Chromohalobacter salexigens]NWO55015.1 hypothetical protein [Chromohalobacter salexigens]
MLKSVIAKLTAAESEQVHTVASQLRPSALRELLFFSMALGIPVAIQSLSIPRPILLAMALALVWMNGKAILHLFHLCRASRISTPRAAHKPNPKKGRS